MGFQKIFNYAITGEFATDRNTQNYIILRKRPQEERAENDSTKLRLYGGVAKFFCKISSNTCEEEGK